MNRILPMSVLALILLGGLLFAFLATPVLV